MSRFIYAARCFFTNGTPTGLLKVGFSIAPEERVSTIGSVVPFEFELIGAFPGGFFSEAAAHMVLREWRSRGEYFWESPECRRAVDAMIRQRSPHALVKDRESACHADFPPVDVPRTIARLGLPIEEVADQLSVAAPYLRMRLKTQAKNTRNIAAGVCLAAARRGIRLKWPHDFVPKQEAA